MIMCVNKKYKWHEKLFDYFSVNHDLSLTQTQIADIIDEVHKHSEAVKNDVANILIGWEQFKKANWWESESIDVEKLLMDRFVRVYNINKTVTVKTTGMSEETMRKFIHRMDVGRGASDFNTNNILKPSKQIPNK